MSALSKRGLGICILGFLKYTIQKLKSENERRLQIDSRFVVSMGKLLHIILDVVFVFSPLLNC